MLIFLEVKLKIFQTVKRFFEYFSRFELILYAVSVTAVTVSYLVFDGGSVLTLMASLAGVSSLILCAKGNPIGQVLMLIFSLLYAVISYGFAYYGEMISYLFMTAPMAVISLVSWLRHPYGNKRSEVTVASPSKRTLSVGLAFTVAVTAAFYFILRELGTVNLIPSTVSIATSFAAAYLTFARSPAYALAYGLNDIVLIVLWVLASLSDIGYVSVTVCFCVFLVNDLYGFVSWLRMAKRQGL